MAFTPLQGFNTERAPSHVPRPLPLYALLLLNFFRNKTFEIIACILQ